MTESEFYAALGARLRTARLAAGMTMDDIGKRVGVIQQQVHKQEKGQNKPPVHVIVAMSEAYGVSLSHLLIGKDEGPISANRAMLELTRASSDLPSTAVMDLARVARRMTGVRP